VSRITAIEGLSNTLSADSSNLDNLRSCENSPPKQRDFNQHRDRQGSFPQIENADIGPFAADERGAIVYQADRLPDEGFTSGIIERCQSREMQLDPGVANRKIRPYL